MSIIADIYNGVKSNWTAISAEIEELFAKVKAALPSSSVADLAVAQQDLKQAASIALGDVVAGVIGFEPTFVKGLESSADNALASLTGGLTVPLNPLLNNGIEDIVNKGTAALQAWGLKQKAAAIAVPAKAPGPVLAPIPATGPQ